MFKNSKQRSLFSKFTLVVTALCLFSEAAIAKGSRELKLIYPLKSAPSVSSTFGTYRINHHHSGIDLYTFEGTPVIAAADGVLTIIKRGSGGYGRAIYLKHDGGFTTLYAHLSAFAPKIERLVASKERRNAKFTQKIRPKETIKFKAGEILGWSGTSGTDLCHLHFELRYKNAPINPLTHGLKLPDRSSPTLIALYADPLDERARVEGAMQPKRYPISTRLVPQDPIATALFPSIESESTKPKTEESVPPVNQSASGSNTKEQLPRVKIWGNVGLSLEVEDRIDGSDRALSPHQIKLFVDNKLIHHLSYDETSYADKRSSELDFDLSRRGEDKRLVHRLYRYGPRLRALKRGSTRPLKSLKVGEHKARVEAIDAAGNVSAQELILEVVKPTPSPCKAKRKRLPKRKASPLWRPDTPGALDVTWRPYGLSFKLPKPCDAEVPLEVDLRVNGKRAHRRTFSLSSHGEETSLNLHFDRLKFEMRDEKNKARKTNKKSKIPNRELKETELPPDRSVELLIGLRGLINPSAVEKVSEGAADATERGTPPEDRGLKTLYWYEIKLHEVVSEAYFEADGVRVFVGEDSPFKPYVTSLASLPIKPKADTSESSESSQASSKTEPRDYSRRYRFAQAWLPMQKANEVLIQKSRLRGKRLGAYLMDGPQQWWVTSSWSKNELGASSTHLADFVITQDNAPPVIGQPQWDLLSPIGPRLMIPISDDLSGLREPSLLWDGQEVPIEIQRSWGRLIYRPIAAPFSAGTHRYQVKLKDRGGHDVSLSGELKWPPPTSGELILSPNAPSRKDLEPSH